MGSLTGDREIGGEVPEVVSYMQGNHIIDSPNLGILKRQRRQLISSP